MLPLIAIFAFLFLAFGLLTRRWPCNPGQPWLARPELADDVIYCLLGTLLYGDLTALILKAGLSATLQAKGPAAFKAVMAGYGWAARAPLAVQVLLVLLILDFIQYWLHRLFHGHALWPFHAIHHSAEDVDWTTTWRTHPGNFVIYSAAAAALVKLLGFSAAAFAIIGPFNLVIGPLVHANLDWTYGPFRYVIASPVFHRWHHVRDPAVRDKNFAPTFPVLDLMFGTFHMPRGERPARYGADGVPPRFLGQMAYPFVVIAERLGLGRRAAPGRAAA